MVLIKIYKQQSDKLEHESNIQVNGCHRPILSISLFSSAVEDKFINMWMKTNTTKMEMVLVDKDQKETTLGMEKFLAVISFISLMDSIQLKI